MKWFLKMPKVPRLLILAVLLGIIGALGAQLFLWLLHETTHYFLTLISGYAPLNVPEAHTLQKDAAWGHWFWLIPVSTTLGGLLSGFIVYTWAPEAEGHGTDAAVKTYHQNAGRMRYRVVPLKTLASAITIGSGGAAGREGPTAQIAAGIGSILGNLLELDDNERRYLILMGMAAGLSAIFKSPLGTAFFAVEVLYSGMDFEGKALLYTLVASAVAYGITGMIEGWKPLFMVPSSLSFGSPESIGFYILLGIAAGALGALLPNIFYSIRDIFRKLPIPNQVKPAIGGLILGLIGIFAPQLLGGGYGSIQLVLQGGSGWAVWVLLLLSIGKILGLSLSIGSGGSGGIFAPTLYVGAMLGGAFAALLAASHLCTVSVSAFGVIGMAALFAGAARVPIASMLMVIEMTGGYHLVMPAMLAVAVSYITQKHWTRNSRYPSMYEAQLPGPEASPANLDLYRQIIADFLRQKRIHIEQDALDIQISDLLESGERIPILGGREYLTGLKVAPTSPLVGKHLSDLSLHNESITGIIRGQEHFVPSDETIIENADWLMIVGQPEAIAAFQSLANPDQHQSLQEKILPPLGKDHPPAK